MVITTTAKVIPMVPDCATKIILEVSKFGICHFTEDAKINANPVSAPCGLSQRVEILTESHGHNVLFWIIAGIGSAHTIFYCLPASRIDGGAFQLGSLNGSS